MSWIITIETVGEEQADTILEVLRESEEDHGIDFSFNTTKVDDGTDPSLSVQDYFELKLAGHERMEADYTVRGGAEMPIESVCGNDCKCAIDACVAFLKHIEQAAGGKDTYTETAIESAWTVCEIYING